MGKIIQSVEDEYAAQMSDLAGSSDTFEETLFKAGYLLERFIFQMGYLKLAKEYEKIVFMGMGNNHVSEENS